MNAKPDERKEERIAAICDIYHHAGKAKDELVLSVDEATGIQALERIADDLPIARGVATDLEDRK